MKPHLLQYLLWKEQLQPGETLDLKKASSDIALVLSGILTNKVRSRHYVKENLPKEYTGELRFRLSLTHLKESRIILSKQSVRDFNNYLHRNLHELLLDRVMMFTAKPYNLQERDIICNFRTDIGADEEMVSFDALHKAQQRLRKDKKIVHSRSQIRRNPAIPHKYLLSG